VWVRDWGNRLFLGFSSPLGLCPQLSGVERYCRVPSGIILESGRPAPEIVHAALSQSGQAQNRPNGLNVRDAKD